MKRNGLKFHLYLIFVAVIFTSCDLNDNGSQIPVTQYEYLVSYTQVASYPEPIVKALFKAVADNYPDAAGLDASAKYGVWVYKLNYKTKFKNEDVVASGLVCIPMATGTFPLLSFQNGTNTLHSKAPSASYNDSLFTLVEAVASAGFIVAFPDYLGFGASKDMFHPYLHKASTIQSVTDMFRAIREMTQKIQNVTVSKDTYLMGYSQGGWATMALKKELETKLSAEFTLKASACGAGPYDLTELTKQIMAKQTYPMPYFMAYIANSYIKSSDISITYSDIFNPPYSNSGYIAGLFDGTRDGTYINSKLSVNTSELFSQEFRTGLAEATKYATLRTALANNSVTAWKTTSPTLIVHGQGDTFVMPAVSNQIYQSFITQGTSTDVVTLIPIPLMDHQEAVIPWGILSLKWLLGKKS